LIGNAFTGKHPYIKNRKRNAFPLSLLGGRPIPSLVIYQQNYTLAQQALIERILINMLNKNGAGAAFKTAPRFNTVCNGVRPVDGLPHLAAVTVSIANFSPLHTPMGHLRS
jgi:hypothetical protein